MHNISTSDIQPVARRRCSSEGKREKSRPRPVSALIYPVNRRRSDTEPSSSPQALFRASSSNSTRNLSESDSSLRSKTPSVLNRLLPRRRSKEGKFCMLLITQFLFDDCCYQHSSASSKFVKYRINKYKLKIKINRKCNNTKNEAKK